MPRKAFVNGHRLIGLLREGQQRQVLRPQGHDIPRRQRASSGGDLDPPRIKPEDGAARQANQGTQAEPVRAGADEKQRGLGHGSAVS